MSKRFDDMTAKELAEARKDLQHRLQSTIQPSRVLNLTNRGVDLQGGKMQARFDATKNVLYVHSTGGTRYAGGELSVSQLKHAQNVLARFFARANGLDLGGIDL